MSYKCGLCGGKGARCFSVDNELPSSFLCDGCYIDAKELFSLAAKEDLTAYNNYKRAFLEDFHHSMLACRLVEAADYKISSYQAKINQLKAAGKTGYYEYKAISIVDESGTVDVAKLTNELNKLGLEGWRLQCAYSNELGKNALSVGSIGVNTTADQNILIFERFIDL